MAIILLQTNDITKNTIIGGNVDIDRLLPAVKACQETMIRKLLGIPLYTKMTNDYLAGNGSAGFTGLYLELYNDYIKPMLIHGSSDIFLRSGAYLVSNNGITKSKTPDADSISKEEVDYLAQASRGLYRDYERDYRDWIKVNGPSIPEYSMTIKTSDRIVNVGGWVLPRVRRC
ncbi:hypothetical protein UFOVP639_6 [uncultured Caudovirales phage]|uniref:Uncharacterized protein n=1 Tax=uncultured Caudovirales phage TaxID=2100421 RepID=A0A6J5N442_9CAUD|nr:hypothetical protein UFOVP639_6 [uncultured Caudovirales phage]